MKFYENMCFALKLSEMNINNSIKSSRNCIYCIVKYGNMVHGVKYKIV